MYTGPSPSLWPPEKLYVPPPGSATCVSDAAPLARVWLFSVLPAALAKSANMATCTHAVSGAVHVTGVEDVAVTGLLMTAPGSAACTVAKHFFIVGSLYQTDGGGLPPAVMASLRIDWVYPALFDT